MTIRHEPAADGNPTNLRHCTIDGCHGRYQARGLCNRHYMAWLTHGTPVPDAGPRQPLPASWKVPRP